MKCRQMHKTRHLWNHPKTGTTTSSSSTNPVVVAEEKRGTNNKPITPRQRPLRSHHQNKRSCTLLAVRQPKTGSWTKAQQNQLPPAPISILQGRSHIVMENWDDDFEVSRNSTAKRRPPPNCIADPEPEEHGDEEDDEISKSQSHPTQSQTTNMHDYANNPSKSNITADFSAEPIDCMCWSSFDDGFSIACDRCG
ncbi:hypothetical protein CPC08DRAFT_260028 [Agrocybe pediades]|nr:hypothetical protein CPC08DRAFT_260028 [Agrocybe pediades]